MDGIKYLKQKAKPVIAIYLGDSKRPVTSPCLLSTCRELMFGEVQ